MPTQSIQFNSIISLTTKQPSLLIISEPPLSSSSITGFLTLKDSRRLLLLQPWYVFIFLYSFLLLLNIFLYSYLLLPSLLLIFLCPTAKFFILRFYFFICTRIHLFPSLFCFCYRGYWFEQFEKSILTCYIHSYNIWNCF